MAIRYSNNFSLNDLKQTLYIKKGKVESAVGEAVREGAKEIMEQSKDNVPVDTYNLEEAHRLVERVTRAGNVAIDIEVSGEGEGSTDPRPVEEYAMFIHEAEYNLGEKSLAKKASGKDVGRKFMERAVQQKKPEVIARVRKAVKDNI